MARPKKTGGNVLSDLYVSCTKRYLAEKLLADTPLDAEDRQFIAESLSPELFKPQKKPAHRPVDSATTERRDFGLCLEYLEKYNNGCSDSAFMDVADTNNMTVSAVKKAVGGKGLMAVRNALNMGLDRDHPVTFLMYIGSRRK